MKTISEFIMEQETGYSDQNCGIDSDFIRRFSEYESAMSIMNCYYEQLHIIEFAMEYEIPSIIIEEETATNDSILKKIGNGIKTAWQKFISIIGGFFKRIFGFFIKNKANEECKKAEDAVEKLSNDSNVSPQTPMSEIINDPKNGVSMYQYRLVTMINIVDKEFEIIQNGCLKISEFIKQRKSTLVDEARGANKSWDIQSQKYTSGVLSTQDPKKVPFSQYESIVKESSKKLGIIDKRRKDIDKLIVNINKEMNTITVESDDVKEIKEIFNNLQEAMKISIQQYEFVSDAHDYQTQQSA